MENVNQGYVLWSPLESGESDQRPPPSPAARQLGTTPYSHISFRNGGSGLTLTGNVNNYDLESGRLANVVETRAAVETRVNTQSS